MQVFERSPVARGGRLCFIRGIVSLNSIQKSNTLLKQIIQPPSTTINDMFSLFGGIWKELLNVTRASVCGLAAPAWQHKDGALVNKHGGNSQLPHAPQPVSDRPELDVSSQSLALGLPGDI